MRHVYRSMLVVIMAVAALSAVMASSALAAPEWAVKAQGGVNVKVTSAFTVKQTPKLTITDTTNNLAVTCEISPTGSIEAGGVGKINGLTNCKGSNACVLVSAQDVNLPWKTELYKKGEQYRDRIVSGGSGTPELAFECEVGGIRESDNCGLNTSANIENEVSGTVKQRFDGESAKTNCLKGGGEKTGKVEGAITVAPPTGFEGVAALEGAGSLEWLQGGAKLSEPAGTIAKGKLKFADTATGVTLECEVSGEGSAGAGTAGTVTKWTASNCTVTAGECGSPAVEALGLPWQTKLAFAAEKVQNLITTEKGKGPPGYQFWCTVSGIRIQDPCTATTLSTSMKNVTAGVNATFDGEKLNCSVGGSGSGSLEGTLLIEPIKGAKLTVA